MLAGKRPGAPGLPCIPLGRRPERANGAGSLYLCVATARSPDTGLDAELMAGVIARHGSLFIAATRLQCALLCALLLLVATPTNAHPAVKQILLLQSLNRGSLPLDHFTGSFRIGLDQRANHPVNVVQVVVGPSGLVGASDQAVVDYIRSIYAGRQSPDLIMSAGGPAAAFARKHRAELFPETPLLFASVDRRFLRDSPLSENESAVPVSNDFAHLVDDILQLLPETRQVFMVIGSGALGQFWRRELEGEFSRFRDRVKFTWSDEMSLDDILQRVAALPADSAIVYLAFGTDAQGGAYADEQVLADLHARANAPLFGALTPLMGHGIVGGSLMPVDAVAASTASVAARILDGEPPANFRLEPQLALEPVFDWRELRHWKIPESRLPPGSAVKFRGPSLWDEYRYTILASIAVLLLQSLLIARLLYERRARRQAEIESRRNLSLAADANRRETMSALASSIGHELAQPLSAVKHNAQALQRMVAAHRATDEEMTEILADIQSGAGLAMQIFNRHRKMLRGRQLEKKRIDLHSVIEESLALVHHDMRARKIDVSLELAPGAREVDGDAVLLQQVFVNLVRNAMEAMVDTSLGKRRITIRSVVDAEAIDTVVSDTGSGMSPEIASRLFTPFVSTKSQGLGIGLTIARSIVDAHGGTINATTNRDGGATFCVTLPLSTKRTIAAAEPRDATDQLDRAGSIDA